MRRLLMLLIAFVPIILLAEEPYKNFTYHLDATVNGVELGLNLEDETAIILGVDKSELLKQIAPSTSLILDLDYIESIIPKKPEKNSSGGGSEDRRTAPPLWGGSGMFVRGRLRSAKQGIEDSTQTSSTENHTRASIDPNKEYHFKIKVIAQGAFKDLSELVEIKMPKTLVSIWPQAFKGCKNLTKIELPESLLSLLWGNFDGCTSLTEINIPQSVREIGQALFMECTALKSASLSTDSVPSLMFYKCSALESVKLGNRMRKIGDWAFMECSNLKSVDLPNSLETIGERAFKNCPNLTGIVFPSQLKEIGDEAFVGDDAIKEVNIPNSVTLLGRAAFGSCSGMETLTIGNGLKRLEGNTFVNCEKLSKITFADNSAVEYLGSNVFANCTSLTAFDMPDKITELDGGMWGPLYGCENIESIKVAAGISILKKEAFKGFNKLKSISFGKNSQLSTIEDYAFFNCENLQSIDLPAKVTSIGEGAFYGCSSLSTVTMHDGVKSLGSEAFRLCSSLSQITLSNSIKAIEGSTFSQCIALKSIAIPNGVSSLGDYAFSNCTALTQISLPNTLRAIGDYTFRGCMFTSILLPNSLTSIGDGAFENCSNLSYVTLGSGLVSIGKQAFYRCTALESITMPNTVTSLGEGAFLDCYKLSSAILSDGITVIGKETFKKNWELKEVHLPSNLTRIDDRAFMQTGITDLHLPKSLTYIGSEAFVFVNFLKDIYAEMDAPFSLNENAFSTEDYYGYDKITLHIPAGTKSKYMATSAWNKFAKIVEEGGGADQVLGDLNGDKAVNSTDLVMLTNMILSNQYGTTADVNSDGKVNGTDFVLMVNQILGISKARTTAASRMDRNARLQVENFAVSAGETREMKISLSNPGSRETLVQFDLQLPDGLTIADGSDGYMVNTTSRINDAKHALGANQIGGITRFLLASNSNETITGNDGAIISIVLKASDGFVGGEIKVVNQLIVSPGGVETTPADYSYTLNEVTAVEGLTDKANETTEVYSTTGYKVSTNQTSLDNLPKGIYIIKGKKVIIK